LFSLRLWGGFGNTVTLCASTTKPCLLLACVVIFPVMQKPSALACTILQALLPLQDSLDGTVTTICAHWTWMAAAMVILSAHRFQRSYSQQLRQLHILVFRLHQQLSRHLVRWTYDTPSRSNFGYQLKLRRSGLLFWLPTHGQPYQEWCSLVSCVCYSYP